MPSLLPNFEYDIFISYRHNDNLDGWVTDFVQNLEKELRSTLKDPITIYFDKNPNDGLLETHNVDKSLEGKLKCLIFIPIISQTYCDSKSFAWQHEFVAFNKLAKEGELGRDIKVSSGNVASRILPVKIHDLDLEDTSTIENEIGGVLRAIEFIYKSGGVNRPLNSKDDEVRTPGKILYRDQVNKVANAVKEMIVGVKSSGTQRPGTIEIKSQAPTKSNKKALMLGSLAIILVALAGYFLDPILLSTGGQAETFDKSIAVLPFVDMSPNQDQGYFCDGISEELINALVKIPDLKVSGRTSSFSFKDKNTTLKQIGNELGVSIILEGSIRKSGNNLRITAQLVNTENGFHLWSETYDRELNDIFKVQDDITRAIIHSLNILLVGTTGEQRKVETTNLEAYEVYLRARQSLALRGEHLHEAKKLFEETIALDPNYSPAYSGLGRTLSLSFMYLSPTPEENIENWTHAKQSARQALEIDPSNAEAYSVLGSVAAHYEWDWESAIRYFQKSVELAPNDAMIINILGDFYRVINHPQLIETETKAIELDPLQFVNHLDLAVAYASRKDWPNVITYTNNALKMNSLKDYQGAQGGARYFLVNAYLHLNKFDEATKLAQDIPEMKIVVDTYIAIANKADEGLILTKLMDSQGRFHSIWFYLKLGLWDAALVRLEEAYEQHNPQLILQISFMEEFQDRTELSSFMTKPEIKALLEIRRNNETLRH